MLDQRWEGTRYIFLRTMKKRLGRLSMLDWQCHGHTLGGKVSNFLYGDNARRSGEKRQHVWPWMVIMQRPRLLHCVPLIASLMIWPNLSTNSHIREHTCHMCIHVTYMHVTCIACIYSSWKHSRTVMEKIISVNGFSCLSLWAPSLPSTSSTRLWAALSSS